MLCCDIVSHQNARHSATHPWPTGGISTLSMSLSFGALTFQHLLHESRRVRAKISPSLVELFIPHVAQVRRSFKRGLDAVNWLSSISQQLINSVQQAVNKLELLTDRVNSILDSRIDTPSR